MTRSLALLALLVLSSSVDAQHTVISPAEAAALISDARGDARPIVIDTRGGYKDYFRAHLPTAHHLNFDTLRGTADGVPVQYLPDELTELLLERAGVTAGRTHLIYATGAELPNDEILSTSMVAYVLEKFGIDDVRVVDGGLAAWQQQGLPTTQVYHGNPPGELSPERRPEIGIAIDELMALKDQPNVVLVDARPKNEYLGQDDIWLRKGHIPGAISFHWAKLMESDNTHQFRSVDECRRLLEAAGLTKEKRILVYCGTSREGSLLRFYLKHVAGYDDVRLYEGSWKEYVTLDLPAETTESFAK